MKTLIILAALLLSNSYAAIVRIGAPDGLVASSASSLKPGDTLFLGGGVYRPTVCFWFNRSGTAEKPIYIRTDPNDRAIIDGSNTTESAPTSVFGVGGNEYVVIENLEVRNSKLQGIVVWHASHIAIRNCIVHHNQHHGIGIWGDAALANWYNDILVEGNTVYDNSQVNNPTGQLSSAWAVGIASHQVSGVRMLHNRVYHNFGEGINQFLCKNGEVSHNTVFDNFSMNIYTDNDSNMIYNGNFIFNTGTMDTYRNGVPAYGFGLARETIDAGTLPLKDLVYQNNLSIGGYIAFHYGNYQHAGGLQNVRIENNTFVDGIAYVVNIDEDSGHTNITFAHNLVYDRIRNGSGKLQNGTNIPAVTWTENAFFPGIPSGINGNGNGVLLPDFSGNGDSLLTNWIPLESSNACGFTAQDSFPVYDYLQQLRQNATDLGALLCKTSTAIRQPRQSVRYVQTGRFYDLLGRGKPPISR